MTVYTEVVQEVEEGPEGPQIGAFFDFDGTLIAGYSAFSFIREQLRRGDLTAKEFADLAAAMTKFGLGKIEFSELLTLSAELMRGETEQSVIELGEEVYKKHIARSVYPESRALVEAHLRKGHTVAVVSSATPYQVAPAARDLGIEHVLCSHLEVKRGKFTGKIIAPPCWGEGKVHAVNTLAREHHFALKSSYFYSDSQDDLALLERVGKPRVLNPSSKLAEVAESRKWPIRRFQSRGVPRTIDVVRSIAATWSLVPTFAAGLPIWALTGSKREALNYSFSLFADTAGALIGLDLKVKGEHHLWEHRPAVFVFNHQSKADVVIMAKLLRRDVAGVGKQEIRRIPVLGQILEFGGVVMIDRRNAASAIEAMAPLVHVMKTEGKSVCMAPEGTRTVSPRLAPFKKGAFHLAIQAGVPIVPVVIQNALDVAPKGEFVFRPATVEVEVLPPVDTSAWRAETIDEHVAEVREMFLKALGQTEGTKSGKRQPKTEARSRPRTKSGRKVAAKAGQKSAAKSRKRTARKPRPSEPVQDV